MQKVVFLRHGESIWNNKNIFTGWTDIDLSSKGVQEAKYAAKLLIKEKFTFDLAYTSVLKRAIRTLWIVLDDMNLMWIPVERSWRLNEKHYGVLQGQNKKVTAKKYGEDKVFEWRRAYNIRPPALKNNDKRHPRFDPRYAKLRFPPNTECLKDTYERVLPYWKKEILPSIKKGNKILISAHGNSLRALIKYLDNISDNDIPNLNIPTGIPLIYEFDKNLKPKRHYYLGDQTKLKKSLNSISNQGKL